MPRNPCGNGSVKEKHAATVPQYRNTMARFDRNSSRIDHWKENMQNWDRKYNNYDLILTKITFFCTILLHVLIDNAVQCNSGEEGMWEIVVLRNMKKQPEKSGMTDLVLFSEIGRWPSEKWLLRPQKWTQKKSDKFYLLLGMCEHQFGCILPHGGPSSQCKIDSLIFFQPQGGRHISPFSWGTK